MYMCICVYIYMYIYIYIYMYMFPTGFQRSPFFWGTDCLTLLVQRRFSSNAANNTATDGDP